MPRYDTDDFKADLTNMQSRLDHVWIWDISERIQVSTPTLYTKTMLPEEPEELTTRHYPSDHLPLRVYVTIM